MIKCQTCGMENLDGSQYCDECGAILGGNILSNQTQNSGQFEPPNFQPQISEMPVFQSANVTSVGISPLYEEPKAQDYEQPKADEMSLVKEESPKKIKGVYATLVIERGDAIGTEFALAADESYIGRWDADNGIFPDVDLDAHDPEAKVSRRHARIIHEKGRYLVEDLGSTNGTFVNRGRRLIPGSAQPLNDGDEIIVGKTFLRFYTNE